MTDFVARKALLADGWHDRVRIRVEDGRLSGLQPGVHAGADDLPEVGIVIPGLVNAHGHGFQRALAGRTEYRGPDDTDTFWTWRSQMYALAERIDADLLAAVARQLYAEMLVAGYTTAVEFHYLYRLPGQDAAGPALLEALESAADATGIRLVYVPVLYERGGFAEPALSPAQQRFVLSVDDYLDHYRHAARQLGGRHAAGVGAHSLRAVRPASLAEIDRYAAAENVPLHIHVAEQQREVDDCLAHLRARPVYWLLDNFDVDARWCLVHATHMDAEETARLAASGAVACVCPSTEANLGDGLFPLEAYLGAGGRLAIGSDSHVSINPFEELRWLEYGQRLRTQRRNVAAIGGRHTGRVLFERVAAGGALAAGRGDAGHIETGASADLVVLDDDSPMLAGHPDDSLLEALVFSGFSLPVDRVMVDGRWVVEDGRTPGADDHRRRYAGAVDRLFREAQA